MSKVESRKGAKDARRLDALRSWAVPGGKEAEQGGKTEHRRANNDRKPFGRAGKPPDQWKLAFSLPILTTPRVATCGDKPPL